MAMTNTIVAATNQLSGSPWARTGGWSAPTMRSSRRRRGPACAGEGRRCRSTRPRDRWPDPEAPALGQHGRPSCSTSGSRGTVQDHAPVARVGTLAAGARHPTLEKWMVDEFPPGTARNRVEEPQESGHPRPLASRCRCARTVCSWAPPYSAQRLRAAPANDRTRGIGGWSRCGSFMDAPAGRKLDETSRTQLANRVR